MPNIQFQVRRGTSLTWTSTNPTLANGEFGFETDTRQLKIGNGTAWNSLPHIEIGQAANWSGFPAYQTVDVSANTLNNVGSIRNGAGTASAPSYTFMNDVSMGLYDPATNVLGIVTSGVERMRVAANGNVGIGTTPSNIHLLQIRRDEPFSNRAITTIPSQLCIESTGFRLKLGAFWTSGQGGAATIQSADFFSSQDNPATLLINPLGGNVGIGTTNPTQRLEISNGIILVTSANANIQVRDPGNTDSLQLYTNTSGQGLYTVNTIPFIFSPGGSEKMRITSGGRVGINRASPEFPLDVYGGGSPANSIPNSRFFDGATALTPTTIGTNSLFSIYSQFAILSAGGFYAASDTRIKTVLQDISDGDALSRLRLIEPTSYEYIDKVNKGGNRVYGFIAQQVRDVMPYAVSLQREVIPDIYDLADVCGTTVTLRTKTFTYSDVSATVNMILRETGNQEVSANFYPPNTIELHQPFQQDVSETFVYGRKVDDFHALDKDAIFTTNVAATQELDRQLQTARTEIQLLKDTLSNMMSRVAALEG